jgi:hypothetical protein
MPEGVQNGKPWGSIQCVWLSSSARELNYLFKNYATVYRGQNTSPLSVSFLSLFRNLYFQEYLQGSRDSVVIDWLRAGRPKGRSSSLSKVKNFLFSTSSILALGPTHPPKQWVPGTLSPEVKRPRREADHSFPTSAEVKKMWTYTSTPPYALVIIHRDKFTFFTFLRVFTTLQQHSMK